MIGSKRVWSIYRKELTEILRDRRTLIAMVVIPVVLYPVLMLGFVWATEQEQINLANQTFIIEVEDERTCRDLARIITLANSIATPQTSESRRFDITVGNTNHEALGDDIQLHVQFPPFEDHLKTDNRLQVIVYYSEVNVHSNTALGKFQSVLEDFGQFITRQKLASVLKPGPSQENIETQIDAILKPLAMKTESAATERQRGGWALGMIIPVILVLMTITGAVYPAIDLTAGERERGTLETLMVAPVPVVHLVVGKFLVVTTLSLIAAVLNIASVGATMHFSGLTRAMTQEMPVELPLSALPIILVCMIPFALLFSAVLVAVCSFARTFKEAQNYVMPVIIGALIPAIAVSLPSVRLKGILMVMPVGNMVLLARDLFQQKENMGPQILVVLLSTTLYAAAAIAVATRLFGQEAVAFSDTGSYKTLFLRRFFKPASRPSAAQAMLLIALLFPATFYIQSLMHREDGSFVQTMKWLTLFQFFGMFTLLPFALAAYLKLNPVRTFGLNAPPLRAWLAAICMGASSWVLAHEFFVLQTKFMPTSPALAKMAENIQAELAQSPLWLVLLLMAVVPGIAEEFLFRGFLLNGLRSGLKKWPALLTVALIFGVYHFMIDKLLITAMLGLALAYLAWQSRSLWPCILFHVIHNAAAIALGIIPAFARKTGLDTQDPNAHFPVFTLCGALAIFALGVLTARSIRTKPVAFCDETLAAHGD